MCDGSHNSAVAIHDSAVAIHDSAIDVDSLLSLNFDLRASHLGPNVIKLFVRKLWISVISWSVCPWQAFPVQSNKHSSLVRKS
jgi:hypothetical protein